MCLDSFGGEQVAPGRCLCLWTHLCVLRDSRDHKGCSWNDGNDDNDDDSGGAWQQEEGGDYPVLEQEELNLRRNLRRNVSLLCVL